MNDSDNLALVFLGVIAFASLVQGLFLVSLAWGGLKAAKRLSALQKTWREELRPAVDNVAKISANLAEASEVASAQARRLRDAITEATLRAEATRVQVRDAVTRPAGSLGELMAVLRGLRRGVNVYRQLGALHAQRRGAARRYAGDEHLFI